MEELQKRKGNMDPRYNVYQLANIGQSCAWMGKVGRYMLAGMVIAIIIIISSISISSSTIISILISSFIVMIIIEINIFRSIQIGWTVHMNRELKDDSLNFWFGKYHKIGQVLDDSR